MGLLVCCLSVEFPDHLVLDMAALTAIALKDPIPSLEIVERNTAAPGRDRTPVVQIVIKGIR